MTTFATLLAEATARLSATNLPDAQREARLLLQHAAGFDRTNLLLSQDETVPHDVAARFEAAMNRRLAREPVFRIVGKREFHGMDFQLNADTLEPRDDTESLVEAILAQIEDRNAPFHFADLGTGSGIIALSLLAELPNAKATATDISSGACKATRTNAERLGHASRLKVLEGPWFEPLNGQFDFIVSNPPYIPSMIVDGLEPEVRNHDPRRALDGGEDGLDAYRTILGDAAAHLKPDGFLALEIGFDQKNSVSLIAQANGWVFVAAQQDLSGNDRALVFTRTEKQQSVA